MKKKSFNVSIAAVSALMIFMLMVNLMLHAEVPTARAISIVSSDTITMTKATQQKITPTAALQKLKEGNERFINGNRINRDYNMQVANTAAGQYPFGVVLSCIDSRIPTEVVFDQGIGDVFNARIAGNFVNTDILGSMEFAAKVAGAKFILVLGHTECGAVKGACDNVKLGNLTNVMNEIQPAVTKVKNVKGERSSKNPEFVQAVAVENVRLAQQEIRDKSSILKEMEKKGELLILGGMYDVHTGKVEFFNAVQ